MSHIAATLDAIRHAVTSLGTKEVSRRSGVPYTTIRDWEAADFRPAAVRTLEQLEAVGLAADVIPSSSHEADAQNTEKDTVKFRPASFGEAQA